MWDMVLDVVTSLATTNDKRLTSADVSAICDLLDDASVSSDRQDIKAAHDALEQSYRTLLAAAPEAARRAASGTDAASDHATAHTLGQISLAQAFAARAYERRPDVTFAATLKEARFEKLVRALAERPMTGVELSDRTDVTPETVSRNLKILRELGVSDYHRDGTRLINFLTPPAMALVKSMNLAHLPVAAKESGIAALQNRSNALPDHMRSTPSFASNDLDLERPAA
ncbi:winged helix-turn-helix domain-containing protein [Methylobacterium sp. HMF5984]|uniref:helix-turn-helix domain-containing protein n=1 Tax=Methylobacterium sp. HMF5984 TaxID=3367370 RepID=UPI003851C4BB